jgi:hypothetical protein
MKEFKITTAYQIFLVTSFTLLIGYKRVAMIFWLMAPLIYIVNTPKCIGSDYFGFIVMGIIVFYAVYLTLYMLLEYALRKEFKNGRRT